MLCICRRAHLRLSSAATSPKCSICCPTSVSVAPVRAQSRGLPHAPRTFPIFFPLLAAVASAAQTNACVRWALKASTWLTCGMFALALKNGREAPGMCPATMRALLPQLRLYALVSRLFVWPCCVSPDHRGPFLCKCAPAFVLAELRKDHD